MKRFEFIDEHKDVWPVAVQCHVLKVSRSGFYQWLQRTPSRTVQKQLEIVHQIKQVHLTISQDYGSPRMHRELVERGVACCENTVAKLMRRERITARTRRRFKVITTDSNHSSPIAENHLNRQFVAEKPNQVWLTDFTYIATNAGVTYLCAVEDLCSRKIVGWAVSDTIDAQLACDALKQAIDLRNPNPGLVVHSDRGSQFASDAYRAVLDQHRLVPSMSRRGNCYDNAPMESFFGRFKVEHIQWNEFDSIHDVRRSVAEYIGQFYNTVRRHSSLGYVSPVQFENKQQLVIDWLVDLTSSEPIAVRSPGLLASGNW